MSDVTAGNGLDTDPPTGFQAVMSDTDEVSEAPKRTRRRSESLEIDKQKLAARVRQFYDNDIANRSSETEQRAQRYAKYRMWTEGRNFPWPDSSDVAIPDLTEKSLRIQDTLFNAVLQQERTVSAVAKNLQYTDQQDKVDNLIHHQFFVENKGEVLISDMAEEFTNEPSCTIFIPWIEERREIQDLLRFDPIPDGTEPAQWFATILQQHFGQQLVGAKPEEDGWEWTIQVATGGEPVEAEAEFYTADNGDVEMVLTREAVTFDGPCPQVLDYDDVLFPVEAGNLQIPGPANSNGASHVIVRSFPTVNEIRRLAKQGVYDLVTEDELKSLDKVQSTVTENSKNQQKNSMQGVTPQNPPREAASHQRVIRLWCFDSIDIDGDGIDEDVVITMIYQPSIILQVRRLTELYPFNPPRRPFAEGSFLPVKGRKAGMSILELGEGIHDTMKICFDQLVDSNTISITPWGLYRPQGSINAEKIAIEPGVLHPSADPTRDVYIPQTNNQAAQGTAINLITMLSNMEERLSMINDTSFGRVPAGKSSALRTIGGMALLQGQGEARPERILRRFFMMLTEVWAQIHELNKRFLPREKQIRVLGTTTDESAAYQTIGSRSEINGRFDFEFSANAINMTKQAMQQALREFGAAAFSPLTLQAGIADPPGLYRYIRDYAKALGIDPRRYAKQPPGTQEGPPISAEEALAVVLSGRMPFGHPAEAGGALEHMQALVAIANSDEVFGHLTGQQTELFGMWLKKIRDMAAAEMQQRQQLAIAAQQAQQQQAGAPGRPAETAEAPPQNGPQVAAGNELIDESLPGAGGGAVQ